MKKNNLNTTESKAHVEKYFKDALVKYNKSGSQIDENFDNGVFKGGNTELTPIQSSKHLTGYIEWGEPPDQNSMTEDTAWMNTVNFEDVEQPIRTTNNNITDVKIKSDIMAGNHNWARTNLIAYKAQVFNDFPKIPDRAIVTAEISGDGFWQPHQGSLEESSIAGKIWTGFQILGFNEKLSFDNLSSALETTKEMTLTRGDGGLITSLEPDLFMESEKEVFHVNRFQEAGAQPISFKSSFWRSPMFGNPIKQVVTVSYIRIYLSMRYWTQELDFYKEHEFPIIGQKPTRKVQIHPVNMYHGGT